MVDAPSSILRIRAKKLIERAEERGYAQPPPESPLLWTRGVAARETLSYLDRRGINAEPALLGVRWSRRQPRGGSHKKIGINPMHYPLIKCPSGARQARQGHHLGADLHCEIAELLDSLHLQRLEDQRREFGVLLQIQPDLLDQLTRLFEVAVVGDADRDLVRRSAVRSQPPIPPAPSSPPRL